MPSISYLRNFAQNEHTKMEDHLDTIQAIVNVKPAIQSTLEDYKHQYKINELQVYMLLASILLYREYGFIQIPALHKHLMGLGYPVRNRSSFYSAFRGLVRNGFYKSLGRVGFMKAGKFSLSNRGILLYKRIEYYLFHSK